MIANKLPTSYQCLQISVRALVHPRTVRRCYQSLPVRETVATRVAQAARELKLPEPNAVLAK